MSKAKLETLSVPQLVERFAAIGLAQDEALLMDEISKFNRLYDQLKDVEAELKIRDRDQRRALMDLYEHPNAQVRLNAAKATLAVAPEAGRRMLHSIVEAREFPQAGDASMSLRNLDRGIFKPT